jgi:hypothetical protein
MGRWIDFENDYKTMNLQYMESVWWVFKQLYDKGLVYRSFKVGFFFFFFPKKPYYYCWVMYMSLFLSASGHAVLDGLQYAALEL